MSNTSDYSKHPIGRVLYIGPAQEIRRQQFGVPRKVGVTVRSFDEYSKDALLLSNNYWIEGELVYTKTYVDRAVAQAVEKALRREKDGPDYTKAEEDVRVGMLAGDALTGGM